MKFIFDTSPEQQQKLDLHPEQHIAIKVKGKTALERIHFTSLEKHKECISSMEEGTRLKNIIWAEGIPSQSPLVAQRAGSEQYHFGW